MEWSARVDRLLRYDNICFGLVLIPLAGLSWYTFFERLWQYRIYFYYGIIEKPVLNLLSVAASAVYLSIVAFILVTAQQPQARLSALVPNLLAVIGGFGIYALGLIRPKENWAPDVYPPLLLLTVGALLVLVALAYLRRSFSVTPQARRMTRVGPYRFVRHPMYLGNLLTLCGLAWINGSTPAIVLCAAMGGLQLVRAHYEEELLSEFFPEYRVYRADTPAFIPAASSFLRTKKRDRH